MPALRPETIFWVYVLTAAVTVIFAATVIGVIVASSGARWSRAGASVRAWLKRRRLSDHASRGNCTTT